MSIFHIAHVSDWQDALESGSYRVSTRDAMIHEVGYIHASRDRDQVSRVAMFVYSDDPLPLCVLELDESAISAAGVTIRFEDGGDGEDFPHVYGALDPRWVTAVLRARFEEGTFVY